MVGLGIDAPLLVSSIVRRAGAYHEPHDDSAVRNPVARDASAKMRFERVCLISHLLRGLNRGQRLTEPR